MNWLGRLFSRLAGRKRVTPSIGFKMAREFWLGQGTDHCGRTLEYILNQSDSWLEDTHDFIQWLFPITEPSPHNPFAPVLTDVELALLGRDEDVRDALGRALARMQEFLGLAGSALFAPQSRREWMNRTDHNDLRISRMLTCLWKVGMGMEARALTTRLEFLFANTPHKQYSLGFWRQAVGPSKIAD
jgi:hypothetical protein